MTRNADAGDGLAVGRNQSGTAQDLRAVVAKRKGFVMLAYFDPGSGSMLVQVLVGGAAGIAVFARYLWDHFAVGALLRRRKAEASVATR